VSGKTSLLDLGRVRRALRHPNYRLFFIGQGVSLVGTCQFLAHPT